MTSLSRSVLCSLACALALVSRAAALESAPTQPEMIQTQEFTFPSELKLTGYRTGEADLVISVDSTGALTDVLVTAYTRKQFADEAVKTIKAWTFRPSLTAGAPSGWVRHLQIAFRVDGI